MRFTSVLIGWFLYVLKFLKDLIAPNRLSPSCTPTSVNYHFTRQCNYSCGFCFHTAKTSYVLPMEEAKTGLGLLKDSGMVKINFSGGEPFIHKKGKYLGELVRYCKLDLMLDSVSIVSNGSLITEDWFERYALHLDILAISCDSFNPETNQLIGRKAHSTKTDHIDKLQLIKRWCYEYQVAFKVFQCLLIDGENAGENALRTAETFVVSDEQFQEFLKCHRSLGTLLVPESNEKMRNSYLILDEYMRFLDNRHGKKTPSKSILDVGVNEALRFSGFDEEMFLKRGGKYVWSKKDMKLAW